MKITRIAIKNFLGARNVDAHLSKPINLFAGENGAGKSSIQEAVRMALTGESVRVDAMLSEAITHLSGEKLLVLDRFDVLDLGGREDLLLWLSDLAEDGEIETALIFGTLKGLPVNLPENIAAHLVYSGVCPNEGIAA